MKTKFTEIQKIYRDIKEVYKKLENLKAFENFGRTDCFHLIDEDGQGMAIFSDVVWKGHPGVQMFMKNPGLNHVHDLITCTNSYGMDRTFANVHAVTIVPKEDLEDVDKAFLKKMRCNVTASNNLMLFIIKEGRGFVQPTKADLLNILYYLTYLHSMIENDFDQLKEIFDNELMAMGTFNNEKMTYKIGPLPDITFERLPGLKKVNEPFYEEAIKYNYISEKCRIGRLYLPIKEKPTDYFSSVVFVYFENMNKWFTTIFDCKPDKIADYMYAFLDDIFKEYGMPDEMEISDRHIFAGISKTMKKLNIEVTFLREENDFAKNCYGRLSEVLTRISMLNQEFEELIDSDSEQEFLEKIENKMTTIFEEQNEEEYEYDLDEEFLSDDSDDFLVA